MTRFEMKIKLSEDFTELKDYLASKSAKKAAMTGHKLCGCGRKISVNKSSCLACVTEE